MLDEGFMVVSNDVADELLTDELGGKIVSVAEEVSVTIDDVEDELDSVVELDKVDELDSVELDSVVVVLEKGVVSRREAGVVGSVLVVLIGVFAIASVD